MSTRTKLAISVVGGLIVVAAVGSYILSPSGVSVETVTARRGPLEEVVREAGTTRAKTRYVVAAPVTGTLTRTSMKEGSRVETGDTMGSISPPRPDPGLEAVLRAEVDAAEASRMETRVTLTDAERALGQSLREVERRRPLLDVGAISRETLERFEVAAEASADAVDRANAALGAAEAAVEAARARLLGIASDGGVPDAATPIRAPATGVVLAVFEPSERTVQAGTPLFEIGGAADGLEIVTDVLTEQAVEVAPGQSVRITDWGGSEDLSGRVAYIEPAAFTRVSALGVEEQRVNVVVDIDAPPPTLGAGYRVESTIVTWSGDDVLTVPSTAIFQQDGQWTVFTVEDGRAHARPVLLGRRGDENVELESGIDDGETVIVFPSGEISEGARVAVDSP